MTEKSQAVSREKPEIDAAADVENPKAKTPARSRPPAIANRSSDSERALDPATQMLIDSELKDLPPEERKRWKSYLASVEPAKIPQVLRRKSEGFVPPDVSRSADSAEPGVESSAGLSTGKKRSISRNIDSEAELDAPSPEVQQISGQEQIADPSSPEERPTIEIALEDEEPVESDATADAFQQTAMTDGDAPALETPGHEKHRLDGIKMWPHGKRGDRSFSDRLSAGRLPPLTPPWNRGGDPAEGGKAATPPTRLKSDSDGHSAPILVEESVRPDPKADYWQDELRKLISLMEAEASRPPADDSPAERQAHIQRQVYLRMLYLMAAEPEKAQLPISDVKAVDQEFWTSMFWGMSNYFDDEQTGDPGTRAAQTIAQLNSAARQLQSVADLELRNVSFCSQIDGWGLYERFDRDEFEPGQDVLLYGEIRNFSSEATAAGMYRTMVSSTIEIVRRGQEETVLERTDLGDTEDLCRGLRSDFYNSYRIGIPAHLTPGSYQLRLTVEDKLSGRFATQTIGFTIR